MHWSLKQTINHQNVFEDENALNTLHLNFSRIEVQNLKTRRTHPVCYQGEIVEFRFSDGVIKTRSAKQIRNFLLNTENVDEALYPSRIELQLEVGDVLSWDHLRKRHYGKLLNKANTKTKGSYLVVSPYNDKNENLNIKIHLRYSSVISIMKKETWNHWKYSKNTEEKLKIDTIIKNDIHQNDNPQSKIGLYYLIVDTKESELKNNGKFQQIYANMLSYKDAYTLKSELLELGISEDRITILQDQNEKRFSQKFGAFLHTTSIGYTLLWILRLFHPQYRRRKCINVSGNSKKIYLTKELAKQEVKTMVEDPMRIKNTYYCKKHLGWHIGKK